jgi:hypothetical protein
VATEVRVQVLGAQDSDAHELAELMRRLKDDLRHLDADDVRHLPAEAPPGAKGAALDWAQVIVTLSGSLPPLIALVRGFSRRNRDCAVLLEADGDTLRLEGGSEDERRQLAEAWLARRQGAGP